MSIKRTLDVTLEFDLDELEKVFGKGRNGLNRNDLNEVISFAELILHDYPKKFPPHDRDWKYNVLDNAKFNMLSARVSYTASVKSNRHPCPLSDTGA